jgi:mRNA interferase MazF
MLLAEPLNGSRKSPIFITTPTSSNVSDRDRDSFGAIVLTDFPFTDLTAAKRRPALVISTNNDSRADVIVAYITSVPRDDPNSRPIEATPGTGLKIKSLVRFDKIATIDKSIIAGRLGNADQLWLNDARKIFFSVFGFGTPTR